MNEVDRIALGQKIAGTNQYKVLASVMENMTTAVNAYTVAQEAAGSASRENARYMESLNKMGFYKQV